MSRFFHGGLSDSESSSSDEEELYSEEESGEEESSEDEKSAGEDESEDDSDEEGGSRFLRGAEGDDSDEEDGKRTVKSAKDKRQEEIEGMIKSIENAEKINDWVTISAGWLFFCPFAFLFSAFPFSFMFCGWMAGYSGACRYHDFSIDNIIQCVYRVRQA